MLAKINPDKATFRRFVGIILLFKGGFRLLQQCKLCLRKLVSCAILFLDETKARKFCLVDLSVLVKIKPRYKHPQNRKR